MNPQPRRQNRARYILRNTLSSYVRDFVDVVSFIILIPFLINTLGQETFGLWSLIWSFIGLFGLIDMGFGMSVVKYLGDARGKGDLKRHQKLVSTLFWTYVALGMLLLLGVSGSLLFFNRIFSIPPNQQSTAQAVLLILGVRSALSMPLDLARGVLISHQRYSVVNGYRSLATVGYFVVVLVVIRWLPDLRVLAVLNMLMGLVPRLAMWHYARRTLPAVTVHPRYFDRRLVRELSSFSIYFAFTQISGLIYTRVDALIIKSFLSLEMVAVYSIARRLTSIASQFCSHLNKTLMPVVAELQGAGDGSNIRAVWYRGTKLTVALATPVLLGLGILAKPLVVAWTGPDFKLAIPVLRWLVVASMIRLIHSSASTLLSMGGQHKYLSFSMLGGQLFNLFLSLLLIQRLGIVGVAMATFIAILPLHAGLLQTRIGRIHGWSHWDFYRETVFPSIIPGLLMTALLYGAQQAWAVTGLFEVALLETAALVVFAVAFWWLGFNAKERAYFTDKVVHPMLHRFFPSPSTPDGRGLK